MAFLIRPIITLLTLPAMILTLGCFTFAINAAMLWIAAWLSGQIEPASRLEIDGVIAAVIGALFVSIVSAFLSNALGGE